ncbi:DNA-binding transcriptional LysR family regulator [Bradyrhizobium sp. CIR48]|uniref:LysR family transcriptional regulator n=1 Tax=Bradyrhizobium sp. CIR48 TaxID=2663840 RepID=UPI0016064D5B|nr:LysR family transcriptional regulator [Bradyrhizobium sp. CIR48]MBB4427586.1 DNA-binding transcriptional LysR family regulator [Bradyrhizobium sp. CIR48]
MSAEPGTTLLTHADLEGRLLRYFLAVIREGSIRGAAETLNVAPSAVSRQISELEHRLGLPLLNRLPRGVTPTEAGLAIAEHARQQIDDSDRLIDYLRQLHGLRLGSLRVMCGEGFISDLFDHAVRAFLETYPQVRMQVLLGTTPEILAAVAESRVDVGLAYSPPPHVGVRAVSIARQPLCALVLPDHPYALRASLELSELVGDALAMAPRTHGLRMLTDRVEAERGIHLVPMLETSSIDFLRRFALAGMGVVLLPAFTALSDITAGRLVAVPLADPLLAEASVQLLIRSQRRMTRNLERLVLALTTGMSAFRPASAGSHRVVSST